MNQIARQLGVALLVLSQAFEACNGATNSHSVAVLEGVILTPATVSLGSGGTQQFAVSGMWSDGSTTAPAVDYSATGGTITTGGLYTAGSTAGSFRAIAVQQGGTLADTAAVTITAGHSYTTNFPLTENPISEGGRWINGGTVGLDWTDVSTTPGHAIGHEVGPTYTDATAILTGTWGPDQQVTAKVFATNQKDGCYQEVEMRLRSAISAHNNRGYEISFKSSQGADTYVIIVRWNGAVGSFNYIVNNHGPQYGVKDGDVVSASIVGNLISAYKNGTLMAQGDITSLGGTVYTDGTPGMGFNLENAPSGCTGTNGDYGYTNFTATDTP